ncbi:MAG: haloacid dehalogenase-like hydrolase [Erysipelotrichaceae bacterium]|nr:haloacid dehalogenase-like hydrolase [Erysipelotrichaceae bacterium]
MENNEKTLNIWKIIAICAISMLAVVSCLYVKILNDNKQPVVPAEPEQPEEENWLSLWNDDAKAKVWLEEYMKDITDESSPNFIPVENRVAVFDLDGTLFCETDPVYFDHMLFMHRVQEDPDYQPDEFDLQVAEKVQEFIDTGTYPEGLDNLHGQGVAHSFAGMTIREFYDYVKAFGQTPSPGYNNLNRGDAFYLPMIEIIEFLQENQFQTYIVSGTDRLIVRGVMEGLDFLHIPANQIIGSDELLVSPNQGDTDGLDYVFTDNDELVLAGKFIIKNLKMNKVTVIAQEIGIQPVLAFGNSSGDASMGKYTMTDNPYRSMAFMLCCDDTVRENGKLSAAEKMYDSCEKNGWIPISMKNDWKTIYGDEVTRK